MLEQHKGRPKRSQCKIFMKTIFNLISNLEDSLADSRQIDSEILMTVALDRLKHQSINVQLEQVQKENQHLLNMLQLGDNDTRTNSMSSCSTMSLVHLQYKYDELSAKYSGLLTVLEMRLSEIRKAYEENEKLKEEVEALKVKLSSCEERTLDVTSRLKEIRFRKKMKIAKLRNERNTLRLVHNKLVTLLNTQCMEKDYMFAQTIKYTANSDEALLIQEIRKNNLLSYEKFQLQQQIEYLQSILFIKTEKTAISECRCKLLKNKK